MNITKLQVKFALLYFKALLKHSDGSQPTVNCKIINHRGEILQNRKKSSLGQQQLRYRSVAHCAQRVWMTEGPLAFWKGSSAAFLRIGPHQTLTFVFIGLLRRLEASWRKDAARLTPAGATSTT
jgi:hypothetical protein